MEGRQSVSGAISQARSINVRHTLMMSADLIQLMQCSICSCNRDRDRDLIGFEDDIFVFSMKELPKKQASINSASKTVALFLDSICSRFAFYHQENRKTYLLPLMSSLMSSTTDSMEFVNLHPT